MKKKRIRISVSVLVKNYEGLPDSVYVSTSAKRCQSQLNSWTRSQRERAVGSKIFTAIVDVVTIKPPLKKIEYPSFY